MNISDPVLQHEDFCSYIRESNVYSCVSSNFTESLLPCLDETEAYLPDYLLTILNTTYNELCGVNGLSNLECNKIELILFFKYHHIMFSFTHLFKIEIF